MRYEIERLATSIRGLIALEGEAHAPIGREEGRTVALSTYFILGELALRTDLLPIEVYGPPAPA
jgi:hypothetical protein